jgi:hypothetical protein
MILEGILTTANDDGSTNVAPMGPIVDAAMDHLRLRPFQSSTSFANLASTRQGVFHVTDDVELIARAAIGRMEELPRTAECPLVDCRRLADCCRWYAFVVESIDDRAPRAEMVARVIDRGRVRDFFGFNRAKHAVLEAAILATRVHLLPPAEIAAEFLRLKRIVEKTSGSQERDAFAVLNEHVQAALNQPVG